ncbi:PBP1A family penicillin-binding protein [Kurthia senegalensis]|uniref:PBP1A family penicillin-binding protein n=2 Tax=Kurthia senegalensis TaxID=1033740 RepID=UPI000289D998|nr:PBP1A family penicillin-binding protein [Kurthia senegalensis]
MDEKMTREQRRKMQDQQRRRKPSTKKPTSKKSSKGAKPKKSLFKRILIGLVSLCILLFLVGGGVFAYFAFTSPELNEDNLKDPISSKFFDINGKEFYSMGNEERENVKYENIPKEMQDAILSAEDARFYEHHGIDFWRLGGAVVANVRNGFGSQGASTITQQVIKNSFFENKKTMKRKVQEAYLSMQLEREYSKDEIFEMYFNKVLMSGRIYGFGTAANYFYGKELKDLTLDEMAVLAGMPQAPNAYNPFKNPDRAEKRRNVVLRLMYNNKKITKAEMTAAQKVNIKKGLLPENKRQAAAESKYDAYIDVVLKELDENGDEKALEEGISVYTNLDPTAQKSVEAALNNDATFLGRDDLQAGMAVVDTETGAIAAVGGSRNYGPERGLNLAASKHQPGSTMKPLIDYGPVIENKQWSTSTTVSDEPINYSGSSKTVTNVDNAYLGNMSIREALYRSRNTVAVKTFREVGATKAKKFMENVGIKTDEAIYESEAIGGGSITVSPIQMAASYAAFGNNGIYTEPHAVKKIVYRDGKTSKSYTPDPTDAMSDYTAYMVTDMLRDVLSTKAGATGTAANVYGLDIAGKSGTTNFDTATLQKYGLSRQTAPDSWFVGYSTKYSIATWTGNPERKTGMSTLNEKHIPQTLFKSVMTAISAGKNTASFTKPDSVVEGSNGELYVRGSSYSAPVAPVQKAPEKTEEEKPAKTEEQPKTEEPKTEEPVVEEPKTEEPTTEEPTTEEPATNDTNTDSNTDSTSTTKPTEPSTNKPSDNSSTTQPSTPNTNESNSNNSSGNSNGNSNENTNTNEATDEPSNSNSSNNSNETEDTNAYPNSVRPDTEPEATTE